MVHPTEHASSENFTLHVHKEGGTGGHWCAKVIFFALLAALVGILGIILIEHRGTTDGTPSSIIIILVYENCFNLNNYFTTVEIPLSASKWASMLEGWIDDSPPSHDHDEEESQGTFVNYTYIYWNHTESNYDYILQKSKGKKTTNTTERAAREKKMTAKSPRENQTSQTSPIATGRNWTKVSTKEPRVRTR